MINPEFIEQFIEFIAEKRSDRNEYYFRLEIEDHKSSLPNHVKITEINSMDLTSQESE